MTVSHHPDLEALRKSEPAPRTPSRRRVGYQIFVVLLVLGVLGAAFAVVKPFVFPPREVTLASVRLVDGSTPTVRPGTTVEDVGWLEPYPFPVTVRPLVSGVLDRLEVLEGQAVKKDETLIGVLRNLEIENAYEIAKAELVVRDADVARAKTVHDVATSLLDQKLDLRQRLADIEGQLSAARQEEGRLTAQHREKQAAAETARIDVEAQERLAAAGGDAPIALRRARSRLDEALFHADEIGSAVERARADTKRLERLLVVAEEGVSDPRALQGDVEVAQATWIEAKAALERARVALAVAKRNNDHLVVRAPIDGVVMRLESAPGAVVGPLGEFKEGDEAGPGSTSRLNRMTGSLVSLYKPGEMQLRVDVLYGQVSSVRVGAKVTFTVDAIAGREFGGVVHRLVHEADINQNALQAKIRVKDADPAMRPEMLCRVRFEVDPESGAPSPSAGPGPRRLQVPSQAVRDGAVFVFDPTAGGHARRVPVAVLGTEGDWTTVEGELGLSTKVILEAVEDGERVETNR